MRLRLPVLLALLAVSCSTTSFSSTWKDPAYASRPVNRVLVIGFQASADDFDAAFEDGMARLLRARGFQVATASKTFVASDVDSARVEKFVKDANIDLVIQERMVTSTSTSYTPPSAAYVPGAVAAGSNGWYGTYFPGFYEQRAGHVAESTAVATEIQVFDSRTGEPIWRAAAQTSNVVGDQDAPRSIADEAVKQLVAAGILRK